MSVDSRLNLGQFWKEHVGCREPSSPTHAHTQPAQLSTYLGNSRSSERMQAIWRAIWDLQAHSEDVWARYHPQVQTLEKCSHTCDQVMEVRAVTLVNNNTKPKQVILSQDGDRTGD
jgi:hypothetical protein